MSEDHNKRVKDIIHECDLYKQTTGILAALSHVLETRHAATVDIGRKVKSYADNGADKGFVTPDFMAQGPRLNMVGEVKATFSHKAHRKILAQIKKYDGRLEGWMIKNVPRHDLTVLTSLKNSVPFKKYLKSKVDDGDRVFKNPISVIEFTRIDNDDVQYFLRHVWGDITNQGLSKSMKNGITVLAADFVSKMSMFWFYDSEPPVVYTMAFLWEKIFPNRIALDPSAPLTSKKVTLNISANQILSELHEIPISMPKPKREWIVKALDELVMMGMAKKLDESHYIIRYHKLPGKQLLRTFAIKWVRSHPNASLKPFLKRDRTDNHPK